MQGRGPFTLSFTLWHDISLRCGLGLPTLLFKRAAIHLLSEVCFCTKLNRKFLLTLDLPGKGLPDGAILNNFTCYSTWCFNQYHLHYFLFTINTSIRCIKFIVEIHTIGQYCCQGPIFLDRFSCDLFCSIRSNIEIYLATNIPLLGNYHFLLICAIAFHLFSSLY